MQLNYKSFGTGEPVLILHGLFGSLDNWQTLAKNLAETGDFQVFALDQRNHGRSPHTPLFDYAAMAADLLAFLDAHRLDQVRLIGHSMGGKTVMQFALTHPRRVRQLVVVDIAPRRYKPHHDDILKALHAVQLPALHSRAEAERALLPFVADSGTRQFLLKNLQRTAGGGFEWKMNLPVIAAHYADILAPVVADAPFENPTLFVRGGLSRYIKDEDWIDILDLFPFAQLANIQYAGHWVHADAPNELLATLRSFFTEG